MIKLTRNGEIKEVAKRVLLQRGVFKTRVEDITKELGVAKGTFYNYYKSKNLLLEDIIDDILDERKKEQEEILQKSDSLEGTIDRFLRNRIDINQKREILENHLILLNLSRNLEYLESSLRAKLIEIELINRKTLEKIMKFYNILFDQEEQFAMCSSFIMGGIRAYRFENFFYKNDEDFFITSIEEFQAKFNKIDVEKDMRRLTNLILNILKGGNTK